METGRSDTQEAAECLFCASCWGPRSEKGTGESLMSNKEEIGMPGRRKWGGTSKLSLLDSAHSALSTQQALRHGWVCDF